MRRIRNLGGPQISRSSGRPVAGTAGLLDREELERPIAQWKEAQDVALPPLPQMNLDTLLQRAAVEASSGFASLVAFLGH